MITVALIDDHLIVRSGFAQLLGLEPDLQVVAEFGSGREALAGLPGRAAFSLNAVARMNSLLRCIRLPLAAVI